MAIAKFSDSNFIMKESFKGSLGIGWSLEGTATSDANGLDSGSAGGAEYDGTAFAAILTALANEGQITITAPTEAIAQFDDNALYVSGSDGVDRSDFGMLYSFATAANGDGGRIRMDSDQEFSIRADSADSQSGSLFTSTVGKPAESQVTFWWDATNRGMYVNGIVISLPTARGGAPVPTDFAKLFAGVRPNATPTQWPFLTGQPISDLIVSGSAPNLFPDTIHDLSIFGDSYTNITLNDNNATDGRLDNRVRFLYPANFANQGTEVVVDGEGFGGFTICDTGASDLSAEFAGFLSTYTNAIVMIMAGNNDATAATDAQVNNASTGTYANLFGWLDDLLADGRTEVHVTNVGSLKQNASLDTTPNNDRRVLVSSEISRCVNDWNAVNSGMVVKVVDLFGALGADQTVNLNYQGQLNLAGNETIAPGSLDDRHPSGAGYLALNIVLINSVTATEPAVVFLTGPLTSSLTG